MNQYAIDKNIPIPQRLGATSTLYPFIKMEVGDSFSVARNPAKKLSALQARLTAAATGYRKTQAKIGKTVKFTVRKVDANTMRVWRIE